MKVDRRIFQSAASKASPSKAAKPDKPESKPTGIHANVDASTAERAERARRMTDPARTRVEVDLKPGTTDHRARVPEGTLPAGKQPDASTHGSLDSPISGPSAGNEIYDPAGRLGGGHGSPIGSELVVGEATGDGRHPDGGRVSGGTSISDGPHTADSPEEALAGGRGMAGKNPPHIQAALEALNEQAKAAAAEGNFGKVNMIADQVSGLLGKGPGTVSEGPTGGNDDGGIEEGLRQTITGEKASGGGTSPTVQQAEAAEATLQEVEGGESSGGLGEKPRSEQAREAGAEVGVQADGATTLTAPLSGSNEDRGEDSATGPGIGADDFIDQYQQSKLEAKLGSEVDPGDDVQGPSVKFNAQTAETYTANYGPDHQEVTEEQIAQQEQRLRDAANPDEEF